MISLIILVIMAACAAGLYLKGTLLQGVFMIFNAILAGFAALGFYEFLAGYLTQYVSSLAVWAPLVGYVLLFIVVFALLQTAVLQIAKEKTDMGLWPERVGRAVCGLLLGYVVVGNLLIAAAMAPIPSTYPYPRFAERNPNAAQPTKPLFSPDGFMSGLFGTISQGSLSALGQPRSFAMVHAGFVDSLYLNRQKPATEVLLATKEAALEAPRKGDVWEAQATLRDGENQPVSCPGRPEAGDRSCPPPHRGPGRGQHVHPVTVAARLRAAWTGQSTGRQGTIRLSDRVHPGQRDPDPQTARREDRSGRQERFRFVKKLRSGFRRSVRHGPQSSRLQAE